MYSKKNWNIVWLTKLVISNDYIIQGDSLKSIDLPIWKVCETTQMTPDLLILSYYKYNLSS